MNALYNSALRQGGSIRKDLDSLAEGSESSPALLGQISASLTSFSRTVDDYHKLARQDPVPEKQAKAFERVKTFRSQLSEFRDRLDRLKQEASERQTAQNRTDLFSRRPHHAATPENPYAYNPSSSGPSSNPFGVANPGAPPPLAGTSSSFGIPATDYSAGAAARETHALREQGFMSSTHAALDDFLDRGADVLSSLGQQQEMLKGTQRRLYSVGNTLGISGDTIRRIERRAKQDKWIFWGSVLVFFVFCWLVLRWLR